MLHGPDAEHGGDRPHTISSAYEKGHQRPQLQPYTFQPPENQQDGVRFCYFNASRVIRFYFLFLSRDTGFMYCFLFSPRAVPAHSASPRFPSAA